MNRRMFVVGAAGSLLLATGGATYAITRPLGPALSPWEQAGLSRQDPRLSVIGHAVLAPNPHNRQPWLVELVGEREMVLFCDLDRRLPQTDPFDRQIVIGLGAFIELAAIAAAEIGYRLDVVAFPDGSPHARLGGEPIARMTLVAGASARDPLYGAILTRRSTKQPFAMDRPVPGDLQASLAALSAGGIVAGVVTDGATVAAIRDLTWSAWQIEARTPRTWMESVDLIRIGRREIEANPDGISLRGPMIEAMAALGVITRQSLADTASSAFRQGKERYEKMLAATPAYLTLIADDGTRAGQIAAGRAYLRANLMVGQAGLCLHPVSQALQEFPEMDATRQRLDTVLGVAAPRRLHMLARLGYGPASPATPRWSAASRIRTA